MLFNDENIVNEAILVHGLTPNEQAKGRQVKNALEEFYNFLNNSVVVAHHTRFDVEMLVKTVRIFYPDFKMYNHTLDTAHLAMKLDRVNPQKEFISRKKYTLDTLCQRFNIEPLERHTAWGDAYTTGLLFLKLLHLLQADGHRTTK